MSPTVQYLSTVFIAVVLFLAGCSNKPAEIHVKQNRLSEATVTDADGIRSIVGLQRIPSGSGYFVYDVYFNSY